MLRISYPATRAARGPLTFGQRDTLHWVRGGGNDGAAMPFWRLRLPDGTRPADIAAAWAVLLARHEALRTRFPGDEQVVDGPGELPVEVLDVDPATDVRTLEDDLVAHLREQGVDVEAGPVVRVGVAVCAGVPKAAVVVCSHAAADLGSLAVLGAQFADLVATRSDHIGPPGHQPLDQAAFEQTAAARRRGAAAVRHWTDRLRTAPQAMFPVPPPSAPEPRHLSAFLHSRAAGIALDHVSSRACVARQSVVMAAVCTALSVRTGLRRCVFSVLSGNRFRERLYSYVGALAQDGLVAFDIAGESFDDVARAAAAATLAANTHAGYDIDALHAARDAIAHERGVLFDRDFSFNNVSELMAEEVGQVPDDDVDLATALTRTSVTWLAWEHFAELLMCHPVSLGPELVLAMTGDLRYVAKDELADLLPAVERLLVASVAGPLPLTDVAETTGLSPVPRGPDWVLVDSCWVDVTQVRALVRDALDAPDALVVPDGLVAYVPVTETAHTPEAAHAACLAALSGRRNAMTPRWYVVCDGVPDDPADVSSWSVLASGSGRVSG